MNDKKKNLIKNANISYNYWLKNIINPSDKKILENMSSNDILNSFYKNIEFGTSGARGEMSLGSANFNIYTLRRIIYGYYLALINKYSKDDLKRGIVIIHDTRHKCIEFTNECVKILTNNNIKVYLTKNNVSTLTPFVSYIIQKKKLIGGICITASHSPKNNNGIKIYIDTGEQALEFCSIVSNYIKTIEYNFSPNIEFENNNLVYFLDDKETMNYIIDAEKDVNTLFPLNQKQKLDFVFSANHGVTANILPQAFKYLNISYIPVKDELIEDPNFGNKKILNPEFIIVYKKSIEIGNKTNNNLIIMSDPDGDRVGCCAKNPNNNKWQIITMNQLSLIFLYAITENFPEKFKRYYILHSMVSNSFIDIIAKKNNINFDNLPVGPKWWGLFEKNNPTKKILFSFEESAGIMIPKDVKDKDSLRGILLTYKILNFYFKTKNFTVFDILDSIAKKYKYYLFDKTVNFKLTGADGSLVINHIFSHFSKLSKNDSFKNEKIISKIDYFKVFDKKYNIKCVKLFFTKNNWLACRKSGTEPLIKFYINILDEDKQKSIIHGKRLYNELVSYIKHFTENFKVF